MKVNVIDVIAPTVASEDTIPWFAIVMAVIAFVIVLGVIIRKKM